MPLPSAVAAYYAVCRHLHAVPSPSIIATLAHLPPRPPTFYATAVTSDVHAVALCGALLIAHAVPWRHVSRFVATFAPEHGPTDLSTAALTIPAILPPLSTPTTNAPDDTVAQTLLTTTSPTERATDSPEADNIVAVDFSNSHGITPRGAAAILAACLIIPRNGRQLQLELHLRHCPGIHTIDLQPWHNLLDNVTLIHSKYQKSDNLSFHACLIGLALDGCPLRGLPSFTLRKLPDLRWISMRTTRLRNFWRVSEIIGSLPLLVAALFAGDSTRVNDLHRLKRIGRWRANPNNPTDTSLNSSSHARNREEDNDIDCDLLIASGDQPSEDPDDDVHEWMSHALRTIPGFTLTHAFHQHTPATTLSHFRDFVIAARSTRSPLLWLDGVAVSARERQWARDCVTSKFERAPCANRLPHTSRVVSLLHDRELGRLPCSSGLSRSRQGRNIANKNNNEDSPMLIDLNRDANRRVNRSACLPGNERGVSGRPKKRIRNVNLAQPEHDSTILPSMDGNAQHGSDSDTIMTAMGPVNPNALTTAQQMTVSLAAIVSEHGTVPQHLEHLLQPFFSSSGGSPSSSTETLRRKKHNRHPKLHIEGLRQEGIFEHCMDKALVRRRGCARVSYWKQGNERPRQLEYNPGKAGEIVYATANRMLVVADEESGDVVASCRVGGGPGWRGGRRGYGIGAASSVDCSSGTDRIARTFDLEEAIRDNAGGGLAGAEDILVGEGQTSVFGLAWLNKRPDMFVCGEHGGLIHMYNVGWMQDQTNGGCVHACERFDGLTSISVSADDGRFAVSGYSHHIGIFDVGTGRRIETMSGCHAGVINVIKFGNTNANVLLTSSFDGCVRKWDLRERLGDGSRRAIFTARTSKDTVMACFSPDDQWFLVSAVDNEVGQYSAVDGRLALQLDIARTGNRYNYTRSYYMNDGDYIVSGSCMESVVRVYNARGSGALLTEVDVDERGDVNSLQHGQQHGGLGFDVGLQEARLQQGGGGGGISKSGLCVQSLRASPWRPFNVSALLVSPDQTVDELIAHVDLRTRW